MKLQSEFSREFLKTIIALLPPQQVPPGAARTLLEFSLYTRALAFSHGIDRVRRFCGVLLPRPMITR